MKFPDKIRRKITRLSEYLFYYHGFTKNEIVIPAASADLSI